MMKLIHEFVHLTKRVKREELHSILTPADVTKLQTAHFTDRAPY